jgi:hypothetical protein
LTVFHQSLKPISHSLVIEATCLRLVQLQKFAKSTCFRAC